MTDVNGLVADPQFQGMSSQDQQATLSQIDPDFGKLSPEDFDATVSAIAKPQDKSLSGFVENAGQDIADIGTGLGNLAGNLVEHPIDTTSQVLKNIIPSTVNEYKELGEHPIEHSYAHPVKSFLDVAPLLGPATEAIEPLAESSAANLIGTGPLESLTTPLREEAGNVISETPKVFAEPSEYLKTVNNLKSKVEDAIRQKDLTSNATIPSDALQNTIEDFAKKENDLLSKATPIEDENGVTTYRYPEIVNQSKPYNTVFNNLDAMKADPTVANLQKVRDSLKQVGWEDATEDSPKKDIVDQLSTLMEKSRTNLTPEHNALIDRYKNLNEIASKLQANRIPNEDKLAGGSLFGSSIVRQGLQNANTVGGTAGALTGFALVPGGFIGRVMGAMGGGIVGKELQAGLTKGILSVSKSLGVVPETVAKGLLTSPLIQGAVESVSPELKNTDWKERLKQIK